MYTKQHYKALAEIIEQVGQAHPEAHDALTDLIAQLIVYFAKDNPQFDIPKFVRAAYYHK